MRAIFAHKLTSGRLAILALASAIAIPVGAQQAPDPSSQTPAPQASDPSSQTPPAAQPQSATDKIQAQQSSVDQSQQPSPDVNQKRLEKAQKEGFWGKMQPFARKKWVKRQTDPINDRLSELDQVTAKNASDIKDVDSRAQAGITRAQSTADSANQTATAAGTQAQQASTTAQGAAGQMNVINAKVDGLDQYRPISEVDVPFKGGSPILSSAAKEQLDQVVSSTSGRQGYIIEVEAHSPAHGSAGIQNSQRLANVVNRYLVEHDIPVYRLHAVALGNAQSQASVNAPAQASGTAQTQTAADSDTTKPVRSSSVHIRLMENTLAAQDTASPQGAASSNGAERP
jgi:outer membrane protein OmpA-like peptidoglycan-associated protein